VAEPEPRYKKTRDDLIAHLRSQMRFLARSAEAFDSGFEEEAQRLATIIRVLVMTRTRPTRSWRNLA
jgi:hypothetical protein